MFLRKLFQTGFIVWVQVRSWEDRVVIIEDDDVLMRLCFLNRGEPDSMVHKSWKILVSELRRGLLVEDNWLRLIMSKWWFSIYVARFEQWRFTFTCGFLCFTWRMVELTLITRILDFEEVFVVLIHHLIWRGILGIITKFS